MRVFILIFVAIIALLFQSCAPTLQLPTFTKNQAYGGVYKENIQTILVLPPMNTTNHVEAKDYFHGTLNVPLIDRGYYVMPIFLSSEILRKEGAANADVFVNQPLNKFGEVFGADAVLFTTISKWQKNLLTADVEVEVEYVLKSTKTNQVLFQRKGEIEYSTKIDGGKSLQGKIIAKIATAINTATTNFNKVGRMCNDYTLGDMPAGKYHANAAIDSTFAAGDKEFKVRLK